MSSFQGQCCEGLDAIGKLCAVAALGIANAIDIIEACDLDSIPAPDADTHTVSTDIVVDTGKNWFQWKIGGEPEFNSTSIGTKGSQSFRNVLTTFIPGTRDQVEHQLNKIINGEFVIRFRDKNGLGRIFGDDNSPVMIAEGGMQAVISNETNGYTITFENIGRTPYFYTGAVSYDPAP